MNSIDEVLTALDKSAELFQEREVANKIRSFLQESNIEKPDSVQLADLLAFEFMETVHDEDSRWNTHYKPHIILTDGTEYPSINSITPDMVDKWETRAKELNHPILKSRYAGLVWDLKKIVTRNRPSIESAQTMIDSNISLTAIIHENTDSVLFNVLVPKKLAWALSTAISINDQNRARKAVEAMMSYEDRVAIDDTPATWGFSFDNLLLNKKAGLAHEEKAKIIDDLEKRLERISATFESGNTTKWCIEHTALRLAQYYRQQNKKDEAKRVVLKYGEALKSLAEMSTPLIASSHYEELRSIYQDYGLVDEANALDVKLQEIGPKVVADFKKIKTPVQISQDQFEGYIHQLLDGEFSTVLCRICFEFIPQKEQAEIGLRDIASKCVFTYNIRRQMYDADGRLVANLDAIDTDLNGHLIAHISQLMQIEIPFLHHVLSGFIDKFEMTKDKTIELIFESPVFEQHKRGIIENGIQAYLDGNHLVATHLLIPQIEAAIRTLLKLAGGSIIRPNKNGGFDYRTLGDLLNDDLLNKMLTDCFDTDFVLYFKILFSEKLGWNIRNDICHGITREEAIQKPVTDRIMHVLLLLANVRFAKPDGSIE